MMASNKSYGNNGAFIIPVKKYSLSVIISDEGGWDHVSVSTPHRCPIWKEMCIIKDLFFRENETVIQYHPPKSNYINDHQFALHLWRPQKVEIPMPPLDFV
jgi:hypothetical protein